ncbi:bifunctional helix-turn-helix transcriptional regulator/GNAT family N-acetyltransferase [Afipia birgiae]|jgi:DNA-binding MarR family transcriptional regulator/GNAT superfamily N-acetyltransferase|uniref:bifunctional helix-turn-helix transcriptional regulator/GNAT family N-acetyltransferase n=1 Tax=Afipia birgiae TaxID=151414 RepID=UPI00031EE88D|nr:helix-turn-helix domain-containing GNAT family N-acetyltransferase [Afipia birgiae]MBX9819448.1 helix-turn-helix domain-containing GNAT family N-acetyltransferase [Afipia birgiae]
MDITQEAAKEARIAAIRRFNRFYTRKIGVLEQQLLESPYSLTEARVLFELAHRDEPTAKEIGAQLDLDPGYLSRIVQAFMDKGLVTRKPVPSDRRQFRLALTAKGRLAYGRLNRSSHDEIGEMLEKLPRGGEERLVTAMTAIERLLDDEAGRPEITLRVHRPGDMGWIVQQHGLLYAREYGWDISFEALCAEITAQFLKDFDPARERCWIAEIDGQQVGSVFLVKHSDEVAKIRLLLIDPAARGHGLGKRLVDECIAFARSCGYRKITLWTQSMLLAARGIYQNAGFVHVATEPHHSFGHDLIGETWELTL